MTTHSNSTIRRSLFARCTFFSNLSMIFLVSCPNTKPATRVLEWGLLDNNTSVVTQLPSGGSFKINPNDQYTITMRVSDPDGIKQMDVWGGGNFTCATDSSLNGGLSAVSPSPLPANFPKQETVIPSSGLYQGFVISVPVIYYKLDCGIHTYGGPLSGPQHYWAISGPLHVQGSEISWLGVTTPATLDLTN
jgi:hypothetical protein